MSATYTTFISPDKIEKSLSGYHIKSMVKEVQNARNDIRTLNPIKGHGYYPSDNIKPWNMK